mmetsp:Transcript_3517/g.11738  ORF Transcript_3517/g.11738 Transcript_3517/m.11738 type:complete len:314 (-) Transcript_3517:247-1188(-)
MLLACAASTLPPMVRSWYCGLKPSADPFDEWVFLTSAAAEVLVAGSACVVWRNFGWRVYKVVGADVALNRAFLTYQRVQAAAALDTGLWLLECIAVAALGGADWGWLALSVAALAAASALLVYAVRAETTAGVVAALAVRLPPVAYLVAAAAARLRGPARDACSVPRWLCAEAGDDFFTDMRQLTAALIAVCAAVTAALAVVAGQACCNFGRGLKERVFKASPGRTLARPAARSRALASALEDPVVEEDEENDVEDGETASAESALAGYDAVLGTSPLVCNPPSASASMLGARAPAAEAAGVGAERVAADDAA